MLNNRFRLFGKKNTKQSVYVNKPDQQLLFETLVRAYANDLYRYGYWLCGDHAISDDLVQETFLRAWKAIASLEDEKKAKSWLITILRRENARRFERKQFQLDNIEDMVIADDAMQPEQLTEQSKTRRAMMKLKQEYREPLLLQVIAGFKTNEIASMLNLNINTVNTRLFRARNKLKEVLNVSHELRDIGNG